VTATLTSGSGEEVQAATGSENPHLLRSLIQPAFGLGGGPLPLGRRGLSRDDWPDDEGWESWDWSERGYEWEKVDTWPSDEEWEEPEPEDGKTTSLPLFDGDGQEAALPLLLGSVIQLPPRGGPTPDALAATKHSGRRDGHSSPDIASTAPVATPGNRRPISSLTEDLATSWLPLVANTPAKGMAIPSH
jgi:hypothetical protein